MVLASSLPEKPVIRTDGKALGVVHNLTMEIDTGDLATLIVETDPSDDVPETLERTDDGHLRVPADRVDGVGDQVVVRPLESTNDHQ